MILYGETFFSAIVRKLPVNDDGYLSSVTAKNRYLIELEVCVYMKVIIIDIIKTVETVVWSLDGK